MRYRLAGWALGAVLYSSIACTQVFAVDVSNFDELKAAIAGTEQEINLTADFNFTEQLTVSRKVAINGSNKALTRDANFSGTLFSVDSDGDLLIRNLTIDGGAPNWKMDIENGANNSSGYFRAKLINGDEDITEATPLVKNEGVLTVDNSTFRNIRNHATSTSNSGGAIRNNAGSTTISNTHFNHCSSYRDGGAINATGGTVTVTDSHFIDNAAGAGYEGQVHGGAIYVNGATSITIDNTLFQDNFAQHNGGAIMLQQKSSDIKITNSTFKHNRNGNDGAAIALESTENKHKIDIESSIFDSNEGLAYTGQSMGTIWLDGWKNDESMPAMFKDLTFTNNHVAHGSTFASYGTHKPHCIFDNVESYNNKANGVGGYFIQSGTYLITSANIHDNIAANGAGVVSIGGDIIVDKSSIKNNSATQRGGGAMAVFGNLTIKNSEITNNHSDKFGGGLAAYSMYANYGNPELHLENVLVKDNSAGEIGGGLSIQDTGSAHSTVTADDATKIYDNKANIAADDVFYTHANATAGANTTLDNIGIAGLRGIDGWYFDNADDRFRDTNNPTVFNDYVDNDGSVAFYIKAAGISQGDYDGNGGSTQALPITVKYGNKYVIDNDIPVRDGYTFVGWNTQADGSGISLKAGDEYDGSDGWTLYAQWVPNSNDTDPTGGDDAPTTDPNTGNDNPDTGDDTANTAPEKSNEPSSENKQPLSTPETPKADNPYTFDGGVVRYFGIATIAMISIAAVIRYGAKR